MSADEIQKVLNPKGEKPYSGPVGSLRGVVRASGDPPPAVPVTGAKPGTCEDGRAFYGKLFREGPGRELGDVLVAVTEYQGLVVEPSPVRTVVAKGCAYESRTIAMVFGQRLDVKNRGGETIIPELKGATQAALMVAMPGGDPVQLFPTHVGQYELTDGVHPFIRADVFVLKFPTMAVTGLDGKFEISGIPAGNVTVSAYLPATKAVKTARVMITAGEAASMDFVLPFDGKAAR